MLKNGDRVGGNLLFWMETPGDRRSVGIDGLEGDLIRTRRLLFNNENPLSRLKKIRKCCTSDLPVKDDK